MELARIVPRGTTTVDALAAVLRVAAEVTDDRSHLLGFLRTVPPDVRIDASDVSALVDALGGLQHRLWDGEPVADAATSVYAVGHVSTG